VEITFLLPEADNLSPVGENLTLAEITLVTEVPGEQRRRETRRVLDGSEGFDIGEILIADDVTLAVEMRSPSLRLIGYGRTPEPIDIAPDGVTEVEIALRRPFAYVTGGTGIATFDAALEPGFPYSGNVALAPDPVSVISTGAGSELVSVSANELRLVSTSTHAPMEFSPVPLSLPPNSVAISADDEWAVVGHGGTGGGISIVRLSDVRGETAAAVFAPLGNVTAVGIGRGAGSDDPPLAYALLDAVAPTHDCAVAPPASTIVAVSVTDPSNAAFTVTPGSGVSDFAVHPRKDALAFADICGNWVGAIAPLTDPTKRLDLQELRRATSVAILDDRVWGLGAQPAQSGAYLVVSTIELGGGGAAVLELAPSEERALTRDFTDEGQNAELRMTADALFPLELAVLPGGEHVGILSRAYYHGEPEVDIIFGTIIPEMTINAWEYLLVDASTGAPVQRVRTKCDLNWERGAFLDDWVCTQAPGQVVVSGMGYEPDHLSVLNGAR
jgi:hypothetical protein